MFNYKNIWAGLLKQYWFMRKDVLRADEYTVALIWFYLFPLVFPSGPTRHFFFLKVNLWWSWSGSFGRDYAWKECGSRTTQYDSRLWFPVASWANIWSVALGHNAPKRKSHPATLNGFCPMLWRFGLKVQRIDPNVTVLCSLCFCPKSHRHIIAESGR